MMMGDSAINSLRGVIKGGNLPLSIFKLIDFQL